MVTAELWPRWGVHLPKKSIRSTHPATAASSQNSSSINSTRHVFFPPDGRQLPGSDFLILPNKTPSNGMATCPCIRLQQSHTRKRQTSKGHLAALRVSS
jgi:hypothetical protein